jgi:hypothetical protein
LLASFGLTGGACFAAVLEIGRPPQRTTRFWSNGFGADRQLGRIFLHVQGARNHPLTTALQHDYAGCNALDIDPDSVQG